MHVLDFRAVATWVVVGRLIRVCLKLGICNWHTHGIAEGLEVIQGHLLHLVGSVSALEALAKAIALDCLRDDYGWLALVAHGSLVSGIDLVVVVATALELPNLVVREVFN